MWPIVAYDPNPSMVFVQQNLSIPSIMLNTCCCGLKDRSCHPQELLNQVVEVDDLNTASFETWMIAGVGDDLTTLVIKDCNRMTLVVKI